MTPSECLAGRGLDRFGLRSRLCDRIREHY